MGYVMLSPHELESLLKKIDRLKADLIGPRMDFLISVNQALHQVQSPWRIEQDATGQARAVPVPEILSNVMGV
jgi:hypothetical protein